MKGINSIASALIFMFITGCGSMEKKNEKSKNFKDGKFVNSLPTNITAPGRFWELSYKWLFGGGKDRVPEKDIPVHKSSKADLSKPVSNEIRFIWLGHSTILLEIEGKRFLFDPVFSQRASFVSWAGPKRFHSLPFEVEDLPPLDGVLISHDHYDHLDKDTIIKLSSRNVTFFTPLGVGKYLERWGVKKENLTEMDWMEKREKNGMHIIAAPARHFSGRGLFDTNETLWCSWIITGKKRRVFFSGDTGQLREFESLGSEFGPFQLTFIKIGAYDPLWPDIHLNPEEAVAVHKMLKGKILVPIHWGAFNLGLHDWYEPPERLIRAAQKSGVEFLIPAIGEKVDPSNFKNTLWWRKLK
jgi:L-ascorbate metabolism protein UlaG (beta-lactamase superfamily)